MRPPDHLLGSLDLNDLVEGELARLLQLHYARSRGGRELHAQGLDLSGRHFGAIYFDGALFSDCAFDRANMRGADMAHCVFRRCSFVGADLTNAVLAKARMSGCDFQHAKLVKCNLIRTGWYRCDLRDADLTESDMIASGFMHSDLRRATLWRAHLRSASFPDSLLDGAELTGAHGAMRRGAFNIGTPERPEIVEGPEALAWLRGAGADVDWYVPDTWDS
jgi:uncharacterized protein YjbI with pentapeptide repeats